MSELKYQKLLQFNERLKQEDELPRIKVSEASKAMLTFVTSTPDPLTQPTRPEFVAENQFTKKQNEQVQALIAAAYRKPEPQTLKELQFKLSNLRRSFHKLFEVEPKNEARRKELNQGLVTIDGRRDHVANAEFTSMVKQVSDLLNVSEDTAIVLMMEATHGVTSYGTIVDTAVMYYHRERLMVLDCVELVIQGANDNNVPKESRNIFAHFENELFGADKNGREQSWAEKLIGMTRELKNAITAIKDDQQVPGHLTGSKLKTLGIPDGPITLHLEFLQKCRIAMASLYFFISTYIQLTPTEVLTLVNYHKDADVADPVSTYLLMSLLSAMGSSDSRSSRDVPNHVAYLTKLGAAIWGPNARFPSVALQETIGLQFALHVKRFRSVHPSAEQEIGLVESLDSRVEKGLRASPFLFLLETPIFRMQSNDYQNNGIADFNDFDGWQDHAYRIIEEMLIHFLKHMGRLVRTLKNSAEDAESSRREGSQVSSHASCFEHLLSLLSVLYRDRPNQSLVFWTDPELTKFLRFMMDLKSNELLRAFFELLASLGTGEQCAQKALEFMSTDKNRLSWEQAFRSLDLAAKNLGQRPDSEMHPEEVALQRAFLHLLREVVKSSSVARMTLYMNTKLQAINTLFSLLNRRIPVELKASLFESIAAFCIPTDRATTTEIVPHVWRQLDMSEVVPRSGILGAHQYGNAPSGSRSEGIRFDMNQIECQNQTYPETLAFITLLNVLLRATPMPASEDDAVPGDYKSITHYVEFVVEDVFLKIHNRVFASTEERWRMIELCLLIFDQCLKSFRAYIASLNTPAEGDLASESARIDFSSHPAFHIMCRVLSGSSLMKRLFDILTNGVEALNTFGKRCPPFGMSICLALRIVLCVLEYQTIFLDVIAQSENSRVTASMTGLDNLLAYHHKVTIHIVMYVNSHINDEICLLAVRILIILSDSPVFNSIDTALKPNGRFNRLVNLLHFSEESNQIISGVVQRLDVDEPEAAGDASRSSDGHPSWDDLDLSLLLQERRGSVAPDVPGLANDIRLEILNLLNANVADNRPFPTVAHYLLGYTMEQSNRDVQIVYPDSRNGLEYCLHAIVRLLRVSNVSSSLSMEIRSETDIGRPLYATHPKLGEKCYQLVFLICAAPSTSSVTMRYLRTNEDFVYQQLQNMPVDGAVATARTSTFREHDDLASRTAQLHQRAWLMKLIAMELHITTLGGQRSQAQRLLDLLYINSTTEGGSNFDQPLPKMLEILNSIDFSKGGDVNIELHSFRDVDLNACVGRDEYGMLVYDVRAAHSLLIMRQRHLEKSGALSSIHERNRLKEEIGKVLKGLVDLNAFVESLGARLHCVEGWSQILQVTMGEGFDLLPSDSRERRVHELLQTIFPKLSPPDGNAANDMVEALSQVVLALLWRLREDRTYQIIIQTALTESNMTRQSLRLPVDSLRQVLGGLLNGILKPGSTSALRGNYYAGLLHFCYYSQPDELEQAESVSKPTEHRKWHQSEMDIDDYRSTLLTSNLSVISNYGDRFLEMLCRDAADGSGLWKTVAFSVLEVLCALSSHENPSRVINFMVKRNFLSDFVRVLAQREDPGLQMIMRVEPTAESLQTLFIYQAKMNLLLRIAQQGEGVEKLLESGLIEVLADCKFIDQRPEIESDYTESDSFTPQSMETYHYIVTPVLDLLLTIISAFVQRHKEALKAILKNKSNATKESNAELALAVSLLSFLASNRGLMEHELAGPGHSSFHNTPRLPFSIMTKYLQAAISLLFQAIDEQKNLRLKLADVHRLPVDEINAIVRRTDAKFINDLTASQRQQLGARELKRMLKRKNSDIFSSLYIIDHCLLLAWRFFEYGREDHTDHSGDAQHFAADMEKDKQEVKVLINKLTSFEMTSDMIPNHQARNAYLHMVLRKVNGAIDPNDFMQ
ncbi:hypothetical protein HK101_003568 [Irineochytrium annulatum]|nr:hypothetical protein HK101_003568 [Irineochytrium annulatum]